MTEHIPDVMNLEAVLEEAAPRFVPEIVEVLVDRLQPCAGLGRVQQSAPKPTTLAFDAGITLGAAKAAGTIVVTEELAKLTTPGMEKALRDELIGGVTERCRGHGSGAHG